MTRKSQGREGSENMRIKAFLTMKGAKYVRKKVNDMSSSEVIY